MLWSVLFNLELNFSQLEMEILLEYTEERLMQQYKMITSLE